MRKVYLSRQQSRAASLDHPVGDPTGGAAYGEFNDPVTAAIAVGGNIVGGMLSADAASSAADAQTQAAAMSDATQRYIYDTTRADQQPYRDAGYNALTRLTNGLAPGGNFARRFSAADLAADPVYNSGLQFGLDEGIKGLNRQAAAGGNLLSGATLKALTRYGNDYASTKAGDAYNRFNTDMSNQFNRNASLAGVGQTANNTVAQAGQNYATAIGNNAMGAANARGASMIAGANAINGGINNISNMWQQNQLLNVLKNRNGIGGGTVYGAGMDPLASAFGYQP